MIINHERIQQVLLLFLAQRRKQMLNTDASDLLHLCCVAGGIYGDLIP